MKKLCTMILSGLLAFGLYHGSSEAASPQQIKINVAGTVLKPPTNPVVVDGSVLVPMRTLFESLGLSVTWDSSARTITSKTPKGKATLTIDSKTAIVDGTSVSLSTAPRIVNGTAMVPLRSVSELAEQKVFWSPTKKTIYVTSDESAEYYHKKSNYSVYHHIDWYRDSSDIAGTFTLTNTYDPSAPPTDGFLDGESKVSFYVGTARVKSTKDLLTTPEDLTDMKLISRSLITFGENPKQALYTRYLSTYSGKEYIDSLDVVSNGKHYSVTAYLPFGKHLSKLTDEVDFILGTYDIHE